MTATSTGPDLSIFDRPIDMDQVERILAQSGAQDGFYELATPIGPRRYPRVSSVLDGLGAPWLSRWIAKTERDSFRAAAVTWLGSTEPGDGPMIPRLKALAGITALNPVSESERIKGNAAAFGTRLHGAIENHLRGFTRPVPEDVAQAYELWRRWWVESGFVPLELEKRIGCAGCGYGGTLDALVADAHGDRWVVDWKSSKRISDTYSLQLAAYAHAKEQVGTPLAGGLVVRVGKTLRSKIEVRRFDGPTLRSNFAPFKAALDLWRWQRNAAGEDAGDAPMGHE